MATVIENEDQTDEREVLTPESGTLALLNKSEIDQQIATAHKYPRSIVAFRKEALQMVTLNEGIARECIYALPRRDRDGQNKMIEGPSARFAEVVMSAWGNCRAGARVVSDQGEFVTAQGVFHDLQRNVAITYEVQRRIVGSNGRRYSTDMIGVTANAACSIALRNAVLKGVPKAFWAEMYSAARQVVAGNVETLKSRRDKAIQEFAIFGVTQEDVLRVLGVAGVQDITIDHLVTLHGMVTAIKDGDTTPEQLFGQPDQSGITRPRAKSDASKAGEEQAGAARPVTVADSDKATTVKQPAAKDAATKKTTPELPDGPLNESLVGLIRAKLAASEAGLTDAELFRAFQVEGFEQLRVSQLEKILAWIRDPS